jgi:hypothetical protein
MKDIPIQLIVLNYSNDGAKVVRVLTQMKLFNTSTKTG